jgi:hypothetical protein
MAVFDPQLTPMIERFVGVNPEAFESRTFPFFEGDDVARLFVVSIAEFEFRGRTIRGLPVEVKLPDGKVIFSRVFEIYLSRNGVRLLELAKERTPAAGVEAVIFFEVNRGDIVSDTVFEIAPREGLAATEFLSMTAHFSHILRSALGLSTNAYQKLVRERFDRETGVLERVGDVLLERAGELLIALQDPIEALAGIFANGKMPAELWRPSVRPEDFDASLQSLAASIDGTIDAVLQRVADLPRLNLSSHLQDIPGESLLPNFLAEVLSALRAAISSVERLWNRLLQFVTDAANFIKANKPHSADSFDTLIGYLCGLWDGAIDAISGLVELAALAVGLAGAFLKSATAPRTALQLFLEAMDQMLAAFRMIDWLQVWTHFISKILPKIVDMLQREGNELLNTVARSAAEAGYYFGYVVYNIAEAFFPPLKLSKVAAGARAATNASQFVDRIILR